MAMVETLEVRFEADLGNFTAKLKQLAARIGDVGKALEAGRAGLGASAAELIRSIADGLRSSAAMSSAPMEAGMQLADGLARGIDSGRGRVQASAQRLGAAARFANSGAVASARSAGAALSQGFANGISSGLGAVISAVNRIVNAAVSRIRSGLKIHSPSKVSFELGGFFGEGFADGVRASLAMAQAGVGALAAGAAAAVPGAPAGGSELTDAGGLGTMMRAAVEDALGGTSFVIPLHVDGVKLGEASIRGINRVTRSTGRLMLEI